MNPLALHLAEYVSKLSTALFAGNSMCVSFIEHNARLECGPRVGSTQFVPSFRRAAKIQGTLAAIASVSSAVAYFGGDRDQKWLIAGLLMFSILPYTKLVMMPINYPLLDPSIDRDSDKTKSLLEQWGSRHLVRTLLSLAATLLLLHDAPAK